MAKTLGYVCTMLGRRRNLPDAMNHRNKGRQGHALRAAINTPIQVRNLPRCAMGPPWYQG
jgi:DNA polymerase-1